MLDAFLKDAGWGRAERHPLSGDASFRRYIRLNQNGKFALVMDAPPPQENVSPYVMVDRHLRNLGFNAPEIFCADEDNGFLLLEDFGDATFTNLLAANAPNGVSEHDLYQLATDTLIQLHAMDYQETVPSWLPPYDDAKLHDEAALLLDHFMPAHGLSIDTDTSNTYAQLWRDAFVHVHAGPRTLVLRDYHVDNLMRLDNRPGIKACGVLDFQDALAGHPAYDLMSLLEDARRDISPSLQAHMKDHYFQARKIKGVDRDEFERVYAILAAQRHAKVIGIFTRLDRRDGKPIYLKHIDRVWRLLENALTHPALCEIKDWVDTHIPPHARSAPEPSA